MSKWRCAGMWSSSVCSRWRGGGGGVGGECVVWCGGGGTPPYPYVDGELRKVARDAYVAWQGSRYSVPWQYAGREVWVRNDGGNGEVRVLYGDTPIAVHARAQRQHMVVTRSEHHRGIPVGSGARGSKIVVRVRV